jgi:hypothetical protein
MKTFQLTFNQQQLQILNAALVEMPFKMAAPLIEEINNQLRQQQTEAENDLPSDG